MIRLLAVVFLLAFAVPASAKLNVFACEPEWGALLGELAGDAVSIHVGTSALQDVHQIEARPSLIAKMRQADLLVCTGADLEVGWLPQLIRQSGNTRVGAGPGYFLATQQVATLDKPTALDRAQGDVHPQGNPHIQLDPHRILTVAQALTARLTALDGANAARYAERLADFSTRWQAAIPVWEQKAAPLKGRKVVVHHISWVYLNTWLGLEQIGALEPKPGVPPTSGHLSSLIETTKSAGAYAIISAAYQDQKPARWLAERTGVPVVVLPYTVGGDAQSTDLFSFFDSTIDKLLAAAQ
ncbi:MAG TPA: zinc ABC transporter substrate-binding protein [Xanthomonadales bacterium]|nr:zinc ABC transporter substrate-binding protein [Xanthomonadales bacterium]